MPQRSSAQTPNRALPYSHSQTARPQTAPAMCSAPTEEPRLVTCMCQSLTSWPEMRGWTGCASSRVLSASTAVVVAAGRAVLEDLAQALGAPAQDGDVLLGRLGGLPAVGAEERPHLVQRLYLRVYKIDRRSGVLVEVHGSKVVGTRDRRVTGECSRTGGRRCRSRRPVRSRV